MLREMPNNLEGVHVEFLRQVTVKMAKRQWCGTWISAAAESVLKEAGTQTLGTYIDKSQERAVECPLLSPIFEVFNRETVYKGGGGG